IDPHVAALGPTQLLQRLHECREAGLPIWIVRSGTGDEHANTMGPVWLLRARRERPSRRAAEQGNETASLHSITSSARSRIAGGSVTPSALAVLRLTTSWNFVGCSIGISEGFVPLRIFATKSPVRRYIVT